MNIRRIFIPLGLALGLLVLAASCSSPASVPDGSRSASTIYSFSVLGAPSISELGSFDVVDTATYAGSFRIFRRIDPIDDINSVVPIRGTGPLGFGDYSMRVVDPVEEPTYTGDYFYVSGL